MAEPSASASDRALAQTLFVEARADLEAGRFAEACPKLAESQRLDPGGGTLLNLALCHEKTGHLAKAWSEYVDGLGQARREGRSDRIPFAEERSAALDRLLPRVRVQVSAADPPEGLEIRVDDTPIDRAAWGVWVPVDPGSHAIHAIAKGRQPWRKVITLREGQRETFEVPDLPLAASAVAIDTAPTPKPPTETSSSTSPVPWTLVGVGGAALVTGAVFGAMALDANARSDELCPRSPCTNAEAASLSDRAVRDAWIANVSIGAGLVAAGIGVYLLVRSPSSQTVTPATGAGRASVGSLSIRF